MRYRENIDKDYEQLVPFFFTNQTEAILELEYAVKESNDKKIKFIAHRLKGTSDNYGFKGLRDLAREIEELLECNQLDNITKVISEMKTYIKDVEITYIEI